MSVMNIEFPELPDAILVHLPDKRGREVYTARTWRYVPEAESDRLLRELEAEHALAETLGHMHELAKDEADKLRDENAKLRELFNETLIRLVAASEAAGGGFMDARYCELLESYGIEVDA